LSSTACLASERVHVQDYCSVHVHVYVNINVNVNVSVSDSRAVI